MIEIKTQQQRNAVQSTYEFSKEYATLIDSSDGQFSGGYSVAVYRYNDEVIEFGYQDGKVCDMTRFYGELY